MRKLICGLTIVAVAAVAGVRADEEKVALDKLPKAVLDTVKKRFPKGDLKGAVKEKDDAGKTVYEVTLKDKELNVDVTLTPEGAIVSIEKEIKMKDVPKVVADALEAKHPKAKVKIAEEVFKVTGGKEKLEGYEFLLTTTAKKEVEVVISPEGKITKEEEKKGKEKD